MTLSEVWSLAARAGNLFEKQPTLKAEDVPQLFKEPGVLSGYRLPGQKAKFYLLSIFQINNETVNVWTHFIGFFVVLYRIITCLQEFGPNDRRVYSLLALGSCALLYTSLSVFAHTMHSASSYAHYVCFQADYAGIGIYSFGSVLPAFYITAELETKMYFRSWFLTVNFLLSWLVCYCNCYGKLMYSLPYPFKVKIWQVGPCVVHYLMIVSLVYPRISKCWSQGIGCDNPALNIYKAGFVVAIICALTFASHMPEKRWPGYFDFIGQGHQVFHTVCILLTLCSFDAAYNDLLYSKDEDLKAGEFTPSLTSLLCHIFGLVFVCGLTMMYFRPMVLKKALLVNGCGEHVPKEMID